MKRFEFRLETVRRWRRSQMDIEQAKLQELATALSAVREQKVDIDRQVAQSQQSLLAPARTKATIDAQQLAEFDEFRYYARRQRELLNRREAEMQWRIEQQRQRLVVASRNCRLLDQLRSKAEKVWENEYAKELESTAADLYLAKWGRSQTAHL